MHISPLDLALLAMYILKVVFYQTCSEYLNIIGFTNVILDAYI